MLTRRIRTEILEETRGGIQHHDVVAVAKGVSVSLQAAVDGEESRVLVVRVGLDLRGPRVAGAAAALRVLADFEAARGASMAAVGIETTQEASVLGSLGARLTVPDFKSLNAAVLSALL